MHEKSTSVLQRPHMTKEYLAKACSDFLEDVLRRAYDEDDPLLQAPNKSSQETQTPIKQTDRKKNRFTFSLKL